MNRYKKIKLFSALSVFFLSILSFTLFYLRLIGVFKTDFTIFGSYFLQYVLDTLITLFVAIAVLSGRGYESGISRIFSSLKLSLPRLAYLIPYYYLYYISQAFDSLESLFNLTIRSILMLIVYIIEIEIYYHISCAIAKKADKNWDFFKRASLFDFSASACTAIFTACFLRFITNLIIEGIDILIYLRDYEEFYTEYEVFYLLWKIMLAFISLFLSHLLFMGRRKWWRSFKETKEEKTKQKNGA